MDDVDIDAALIRRRERLDRRHDRLEASGKKPRFRTAQTLKQALVQDAGLTGKKAEEVLAVLFAIHRSLVLNALCSEPGERPKLKDISHTEIAMLRPMAETLAMLDGNAFLGTVPSSGPDGVVREHWEYYVPDAKAIFDANGGLDGWAGEASFAKPHAALLDWKRRKAVLAPRAAADTASGGTPAPAEA